MSTEFSLTLVSATSFSKTAMESPSDALMAVMSDILDRAQQLAKNKNITATYRTESTNGSTDYYQQNSAEGNPARKRTQQYAEWDTHEYISSKDGRQK